MAMSSFHVHKNYTPYKTQLHVLRGLDHGRPLHKFGQFFYKEKVCAIKLKSKINNQLQGT